MVIAPARIAAGPGSNPGPGENFFLKLLISTCQMVILKANITFNINIYIFIYLFIIYLLVYGQKDYAS